jgi:hypothetical protein
LLFLARLDDLERLFRRDDTRFACATWTGRELRLGFGRERASPMAGLDQDKIRVGWQGECDRRQVGNEAWCDYWRRVGHMLLLGLSLHRWRTGNRFGFEGG